MDSHPINVHLPLEQLFAASRAPTFVVDEACAMLFRNSAAKKVVLLNEYPALARLVNRCARRLRDRRSPSHVRRRAHAHNAHWLISIAPLPYNLALLHPVFVVHLVSWVELRALPRDYLARLFALSELELAIVHALTYQQPLREIALATRRPLRTLCARLRQLLNRYDVETTAQFLVLIHKLTRFSE